MIGLTAIMVTIVKGKCWTDIIYLLINIGANGVVLVELIKYLTSNQ
jgi:hypothetical protein